MDSGNMSEVEIEGVQPDEVVVTESEELEATEATPQADEAESTGQSTVTIEDEGDQQEEPKSGEMTEAQMRAAWKEERDKRKRKNAELEESQRKQAELEERLARAEKLAFEASVGKEPSPSDYIDATDYAEAVAQYNEKKKALSPTQETKQPEAQAVQLSDDQEFHAEKGRIEMRKHLPDYDEAEAEVDQWLDSKFPNGNTIKAGVIALTHAMDIDYAKAIYAVKKLPNVKVELESAKNQMEIASILKKAASKIKIRQPAKIETKPEPTLSSTGSVNAASRELEKAREAYAKDSSVANFRRVAEAKKKLKSS